MSNIEAYEYNLIQRAAELRRGDPSYDLHEHAISEAIIFASDLGEKGDSSQRILDVGCGLGFMTAMLARTLERSEIVGIDPSAKSIALAQKEHTAPVFYIASAESFSQLMPDLNQGPFHHAILNMVLHAVDDETASAILRGVRQCLQPDGGTVILVVPTRRWLLQKLIEYTQDKGMEKEFGIAWVGEILAHQQVELPVRIRGGEYYPHAITIFNRHLEDYGRLLQANNFGVGQEIFDEEDNPLYNQTLPFWELTDYFSNYELKHRRRALLMSFVLPDA